MSPDVDPVRRDVAATLMPGFSGTSVPDWLSAALRDGLRSVCLYGENVTGEESLRGLIGELRSAGEDLLVALDEEGGDVTRIDYPAGSPEPGNALLGRMGEGATRASAARIGARLAALGVNLDLAPVVDVNSADDNPVIGVRSFGADPRSVAGHAAAWIESLQAAGVAACAKHFPGHGDTTLDSHVALPVVAADRATLHARELVPFAAAVTAGVAAVMTSHIVVPALDPAVPATFSRTILRDLLRGELGFDGVVVSDALDMAGASAVTGIREAAVRALEAGCDLLCLGPRTSGPAYAAIVEAIVAAVDEGRLDPVGLATSARRVATLAARYPAGRGVRISPGDHRRELSIAAGFRVGDAVGPWVADEALPVIVQVETDTNPAVGHVRWGPDAAARTTAAHEVPPGAKVAVVGRGLRADHPAWAAADRLRDHGHRTIVVECGWPSARADLVTFGGSRGVGEALADMLGVADRASKES